MAHDTHDVSLIALIVDGVAQGFTIFGSGSRKTQKPNPLIGLVAAVYSRLNF
jgi:hypothetical protein